MIILDHYRRKYGTRQKNYHEIGRSGENVWQESIKEGNLETLVYKTN